jgi:hypothetical protein
VRRGIIFGLLAGTGIAALLARPKTAEAPGADAPTAEPSPAIPPDASGLKGLLQSLRHRAEEALEAAHQAQEQKEAELRREFDAARHKT